MKQYGIIGYPLTQSFSPQYFAKMFQEQGITDSNYSAFSLDNINAFEDLVVQYPNLCGLNVTIPYKQSILQYVQHKSTIVQAIGACNCLHFTPTGIHAYNTDVIGFKQSLTPLLQPHHTHALILGTGGAALAAAYVLTGLGIPYKYVSRHISNASTILYKQVTEQVIQAHKLIINASPSGMVPHEHTYPPLPYNAISTAHVLYDMVYKPASTQFLIHGTAQGATTKNGYEMLLIQAQASWDIWQGNMLQ